MNERQTKILDIVNEHKKMEVVKLSEMLHVSQVTIRKDLDLLTSRGLLIREHGYAVLNNSDDINKRLAFNYDTKLKIAKKAAALVNDGETVMIESGSSCALLAAELAYHKKEVTIITNSAFIASYIKDAPLCKVILLGGDYQKESQVTVGPMIRLQTADLFVDKLFVGTDGFLKQKGFTGGDMLRCEAVRNMAESAQHVAILTDSTKFSQQGVVLQFRMDQVSYVFTDELLSDEDEAVLKASHIDVYKV